MVQRIPNFYIDVTGMPLHVKQRVYDRLVVLCQGEETNTTLRLADILFRGGGGVNYMGLHLGSLVYTTEEYVEWGVKLQLQKFEELWQFYDRNRDDEILF